MTLHANSPRRRVVILCDFPWTRDKDPRVPLGHASILTALHHGGGADVRTIVEPVNSAGTTADTIVDTILSLAEGRASGDVDVAIGAYVWAEPLVQAVIQQLRSRGFAGRIVLGGPQISYAGPGIESAYPGADIFVRGYGERALVELARTPGRPQIDGVHYAGQPDRAEQAQVDLAALPSPWMTGAIPLAGQKFVRWETQRGCPFRCAFCQHREAGARLERSTLDRQRIFKEIDLFCASGVTDIAVLDPIFNAGPLATAILERFVQNGYAGRLSLQCRAEMTDAMFLDAAAKLDVLLEFGLQTIHRREGAAIRRMNNVQKVDDALAAVRTRGLKHEVSLIFGLPEQTLASFQESIAWCLSREVPVTKAFPLMLLRGTELDRDRATWGLVEDGAAMPMVVASDSFDRRDHAKMAALSDALKATEGKHPKTVAELARVAGITAELRDRWRPTGTA